MRPKLLEIEGLQSFRDVQRIDFEALGETGLFGIFGPTGSGKSTVLDAITFALYGKVKRADGGTQGIINANLNTARVSFTFEIIKESKRKAFRVERTYQRKKGTVNSCEPKIVRLIEVTDTGEIPVADKATEVSANIRELLGLSHEDFTRAVVLPQNSFQEFLLLNNSERRGMLERIFYLEEYGKQLQEKLSRKMASLKSRLDMLSGELKGYADATDEALEEAQNEFDKAVSERNRIGKELKLLEGKFHEAREVWSYVQELSSIRQAEQQHGISAVSIAGKREQLEKAVKADGLLEIIRKTKELNERLQDTAGQLEEVLTMLPDVSTRLKDTRKKQEEIKKEAVIEQPKLVSMRTKLVDALDIRGEVQALQRKISGFEASTAKMKDEIGRKNGDILKESDRLKTLEEKLGKHKLEMEPLMTDPEYRQQIQDGEKLESEVGALYESGKDLKNKVGTLKAAIIDLEQKLERIRKDMSSVQRTLESVQEEMGKHASATPEDRNMILQYIEQIHSFQTIYDVMQLRKKELDGMNTRIAGQQSLHKEMTQKTAALDEAKEKAERLFEQCRADLEKTVREMDRNAACLLSKNLREGEPCPVCGSAHHPSPALAAEGMELSNLEQQVDEARERLANAEKALKEAERAALVDGERVKSSAAQIHQMLQELESKEKEYREQRLKLPEGLRGLALHQIHLELVRMNKANAEKLRAAEAWEKKREEYKEKIQKFNEDMAGYRISESGIATQLGMNRESLEQLEKSLTEARDMFSQKHQEYTAFIRQHKINSAAVELKRLNENDRKIIGLQKQIDQLQEQIAAKRTLLEQWRDELRVSISEEMKVQSDIGSLKGQKEEKEGKLKELVGEDDIEDTIRRIDEKLDGYTKLEKQYQEKLQTLEKQHQDLVTRKALLENQQSLYSENQKNEELRLQTALLEKGFQDGIEVENSLLSKERQEAFRNEIDEYDQMTANIQAQREMVQRKLKARSITEEEWNQIRSAYEEILEQKENWLSRSEVARNRLEHLKKKHDKWVELNDRYTEMNHKQGLFEQIQKLLRAEHRRDNSFIDFIAEERLRYVAAKASETLGFMTGYKYALELDTDAGFIIRDNANGGVHRMVTSLSGGETFLTSLSLALALSEQIQLKGQSPLEFFFLDEGFGTLDNNLLDSVIDSLERLSRKDRIIGIISHVPELRGRIGRRLVIEPPTSQGEGSRVRIEKA